VETYQELQSKERSILRIWSQTTKMKKKMIKMVQQQNKKKKKRKRKMLLLLQTKVKKLWVFAMKLQKSIHLI
jgi:hypothetical protein